LHPNVEVSWCVNIASLSQCESNWQSVANGTRHALREIKMAGAKVPLLNSMTRAARSIVG
jgi:hypothetical protein